MLLPDEGTVRVNGGVAPLIELTGGFVGDLTARDNIWLTGGLHGLSREQIAERFDEIVDFAEIRESLDTPFRHFSSGMQVRLGFAVITTLEEPIVLVDEVLAVGDKRFREKCYERMESLVDNGRTLFLVSHSEKDLERFCKRGLYIEGGAGAGRRAGRRRRRAVQRGPEAEVTEAGPLVVLVGDGHLPDDLERAVASRATAERGVLGPTLDAGLAPRRRCASWPQAADARAVALVDAPALTVPTVYGDVVADPRNDSAVLRTGDGRVVALRIRARERDLLGAPELAGCRTPSSLLSAAATLLAVRGPVRELGPGDFPLTIVDDDDPAPALAAVDAVDEAALRLRRASRSDDGFLSTFLVRPLSRRLTRRAVRRGLSPAVDHGGLADAGTGQRGGVRRGRARVAAAGLAAAAHLAGRRLRGRRGRALHAHVLPARRVAGRRLRPDQGVRRVRRPGHGGGAGHRRTAVGARARVAGAARGAALRRLRLRRLGCRAPGRRRGGVAALSASTSRVPAVMWAKRAVIMPVGERTLLLVVLVPLVGVRWTLWLLLASGVVAAAYTTAGRVGRALASRSSAAPAARGERNGWWGSATPRRCRRGCCRSGDGSGGSRRRCAGWGSRRSWSAVVSRPPGRSCCPGRTPSSSSPPSAGTT